MLHRGQPLGKVFVQPDLFAKLNRVIEDIVVPNEGLGYGTRKKIESVLEGCLEDCKVIKDACMPRTFEMCGCK